MGRHSNSIVLLRQGQLNRQRIHVQQSDSQVGDQARCFHLQPLHVTKAASCEGTKVEREGCNNGQPKDYQMQ